MLTAKISEIFESVQGEGLYLGEKQLFVRFSGCHISCAPCDTPPGFFREYGVDELRAEISKYPEADTLCLTGGEPLCQADFLQVFLKKIAELRFKIYLETDGILAGELKKIIDVVDIVAMDFKLPSWSGLEAFWPEHEEFLKIALAKKVFVKIVTNRSATAGEMAAAATIINNIDPRVPVVLQPDWRDMSSELLDKMVVFKGLFLARGVQGVSILPQAHKYAGIR